MNESAANSVKVFIKWQFNWKHKVTVQECGSICCLCSMTDWKGQRCLGESLRFDPILLSYILHLILFASSGQNNSTTCPALAPYTDQHAALLARVDWDLLTWAKLSVSEPPCGQRFSLNANESGETQQVLAADKSTAYCLRSATCRPDLLA